MKKKFFAYIEYDKETNVYVGYIPSIVGAHTPPSNILKEFAKMTTKVEIVYVPLNTFSSETLRKLRHFHVLGAKRLRSIANDYII